MSRDALLPGGGCNGEGAVAGGGSGGWGLMETTKGGLMQSSSDIENDSKGMLCTGRVLSGFMALFFIFDGVGHLMKPAPVVEAFARLGYPLSASVWIGLLALICTAIYVTPRTRGARCDLAYGLSRRGGFDVSCQVFVVRDDISSDTGSAGVGGNLRARRAVAHANSTSSLGGTLFGDDLADEGLEFGWGGGEFEGFRGACVRVRRGGRGLRRRG